VLRREPTRTDVVRRPSFNPKGVGFVNAVVRICRGIVNLRSQPFRPQLRGSGQ
jgi:hypothetical protein